MSITRLSGGLTPADGADPRTFPTIFNEAADVIDANELGVAANGTAIAGLDGRLTTAEGDIDGLEALNPVAFGTAIASAGDKFVYDGSEWQPVQGLVLVGTRYYTSDGTFDKADPFDDGSFDGSLMRAIRVRLAGAGGGSGGAATANRISAGGGGGAYAEKFITDIAGLSASESVTVGLGGTAGADTDGAGGNGGSSSAFGVTAGGGTGGEPTSGSFGESAGGTATGADFSVAGGEGGTRLTGVGTTVFQTASGGGSLLGNPAVVRPGAANQAGRVGSGFGTGAMGAMFISTTTQFGAAGRPGVVIVEVYA
jgi:hypothetical protein